MLEIVYSDFKFATWKGADHLRKIVQLMLLLIVLFTGSMYLHNLSVHANERVSNPFMPNPVVAVIVIDVSGSMRDADPSGVAVSGARLFIDLLEVGSSRVAVVAFNHTIPFSTDLRILDNFYNRNLFHVELNRDQGIFPLPGGWTDIGLALREAYEILDNIYLYYYEVPLIIFLTDGRLNLGGAGLRSLSEAQYDINYVLEDGRFPIYTIGLNFDGMVDTELLSRVSSDTNASLYPLITDTATDLIDFFQRILERATGTRRINIFSGELYGDISLDRIPIHVPELVREMNIIITLPHNESLSYLQLYDPYNTPHLSIVSDNVFHSSSPHYSIIKIINPTDGTWIVVPDGNEGMSIEIDMIMHFDIALSASLRSSEINRVNEAVEIIVEIIIPQYSGFTNEEVSEIFSQIHLYVDGTKIGNMNRANSGYFYSYDYIPYQDGKRKVEIVALGSGIERTTTFIFTVYPNESLESVALTSYSIPNIEVQCCSYLEVDISSYWSNPSVNPLSFEILPSQIATAPQIELNSQSGVLRIVASTETRTGVPYEFMVRASIDGLDDIWVYEPLTVVFINNIPVTYFASEYRMYTNVPSFLQRWFSVDVIIENPIIHPNHVNNSQLIILYETDDELFNIISHVTDHFIITITALHHGEAQAMFKITEVCGGESIVATVTLIAVNWWSGWFFTRGVIIFVVGFLLLLLIYCYVRNKGVYCPLDIQFEYANKKLRHDLHGVRLSYKNYSYFKKRHLRLPIRDVLRFIIQDYNLNNNMDNQLQDIDRDILISIPNKRLALTGTLLRNGSPWLVNIPSNSENFNFSIDGSYEVGKKTKLSPGKKITMHWRGAGVDMTIILTHSS